MSTTFGIPLYPVNEKILIDEEGCLHPYISHIFFHNVFFRGTNSRFLNPIAEHIDENTRVYPLNNSPQGIYTIKDCKEFLKNK